MLFVEVVGLWRLDVNDADQSILDDQRDSQFGAHIGHGGNVTRVGGHVTHQNWFTTLGGNAGDPLADLDAETLGDLARVADLKAYAELLGLFIQQQNGKYFIINDLAHQLRHAVQSGVQIERGVDHVRHFEQKWVYSGLNIGLCSDYFHDFYDISRLRLPRHDANIGKVAIFLGVVQAVTYDKFVGNSESDIISLDGHFAAGRFVQQGGDAQRFRLVRQQDFFQMGEGEAGVQDILTHLKKILLAH